MTSDQSLIKQQIPMDLKPTLLGQTVTYPQHYSPQLLEPIARDQSRLTLPGFDPTRTLPFVGWDLWRAFEVSWLNARGLPQVAIFHLEIPCHSPCIVESKSLKLYLNSFNQTKFESTQAVYDCVLKDLTHTVGCAVEITLKTTDQFQSETIQEPAPATCLDDQDIDIDCYTPNPEYLKSDPNAQPIQSSVFSRLLKSNCPVTSQPDWASLHIDYTGAPIDHAGLLRYIVSLRNHEGFHEHCVEQIFCEIQQRCHPQSLSVYARYTRRGGVDINPWRATPGHVAPGFLPARSAQQ